MNQIEIAAFPKEGYQPLIDYESWRVAVLKFCDDLKPENIRTMQKHNETDEVFVLIKGECILYLGGNGEVPDEIKVVPMEEEKIYNIKKGIWHNHTMSCDGQVLIVENQNTCDENSPIYPLNDLQMAKIYQ